MGKLVLLVEDDPDVQKIVSAILRRAGYEVETACDGEEGVRAALRLRPAAVLMDAVMPVLDGWNAAIRIKASAPELRVIMLTAHSLPEHARRARDVGCEGLLGKPVDIHEVVQVVQECIGASESSA